MRKLKKNVMKRDGSFLPYEKEKVASALRKAVQECITVVKDEQGILHNILQEIDSQYQIKDHLNVESIQDIVEKNILISGEAELSKIFILYRYERSIERSKGAKTPSSALLTDKFISQYKHKKNPMKQLGSFVYYRTYSRWLPEESRREFWWETVRRSVEFNCSLVKTTREEAEKLYDNIFNLKQFLSGRTFWTGGTEAAARNGISNFNCSFTIIDSLTAFTDMFHILMVGSGAGFRVLPEDVEKIPKIRQDIQITHEGYIPVPKDMRNDFTNIEHKYGTTVVITVGDSKFGWVAALKHYLDILSNQQYNAVKNIIFNYNNVRPKGERLVVFGGTASGHLSLETMLKKIDVIIKKTFVFGGGKIKLTPIDAIDIANIIAANVVSGGVRRSSQVALIDVNDKESIDAKTNLYTQMSDGTWKIDESIIHRQMSNNTIFYKEKPSKEQLRWQIEKMRYSGEPGFVNVVAAKKRREDFEGANPCFEIMLGNKNFCNLTEVNVMGFVNEDNSLDIDGLIEAQTLSARAGYRMTFIDLELPEWDANQKKDRLLGCSLTGWQDMVNATKLDRDGEKDVLSKLKLAATKVADEYSKEQKAARPLLTTTIKPSGTLSLLPTVSSGVHYSHSPYYIRRVRINSHDPLVKVCEELDYPVFPEVGQELETCTTKIVEFPVKAPNGVTKFDISAIQQMENYIMFQKYYVEHNTSITIHVREHEWKDVEEFIWKNWDDMVAVSFLSLDDSFYQMMPYEAIDEKEYNDRLSKMKQFAPHLVNKYELDDNEKDLDSDCDGGVCPVR